tara:strand:- start:466 stop:723 length:258 start_codon:yes stop_codon:yes gene_type:complete
MNVYALYFPSNKLGKELILHSIDTNPIQIDLCPEELEQIENKEYLLSYTFYGLMVQLDSSPIDKLKLYNQTAFQTKVEQTQKGEP